MVGRPRQACPATHSRRTRSIGTRQASNRQASAPRHNRQHLSSRHQHPHKEAVVVGKEEAAVKAGGSSSSSSRPSPQTTPKPPAPLRVAREAADRRISSSNSNNSSSVEPEVRVPRPRPVCLGADRPSLACSHHLRRRRYLRSSTLKTTCPSLTRRNSSMRSTNVRPAVRRLAQSWRTVQPRHFQSHFHRSTIPRLRFSTR
mmetsp:Transcript_9482/g.20395  ORF Transcript_9482/g.20395 Transcript_9482/m.20395 type:complete len:201 (-) Transcript_9482:271-873(-)